MAISSISGAALASPAASSAVNAAASTAPAATSSATALLGAVAQIQIQQYANSLADGAGASGGGSATTQSPADTVTISAEAQQALAAGGAATAAPSGSANDGIDQALTALNDTSGAISVADQLKAFTLIAQYVSNGQAGGSAPKDQAVAVGAALCDSAFGQHAQQVFTELQSQMNWNGGDATANSIDTVLKSFDALSASDQQVYIGAVGLQHQLVSGETPITSVSDFKANLEARAAVERALQAAESDPAYASASGNGVGKDFYSKRDDMAGLAAAAGDQATVDLAQLSKTNLSDTVAWTQQVQAYFAKYGPPPAANGATFSPSASPAHAPTNYQAPDGKTLGAAVAAVNDTSGKTSLTDQISAYQTLSEYMMFSTDYGPAMSAVWKAAGASPFFAYASKLQDTMAAGLMSPGLDAAKIQLKRLNTLSTADQQIYFGTNNIDGDGAPRFASVENLKVNYSARSAVQTLEAKLQTKYGVDDLSQITDTTLTKSQGFQGLLGLFSSSDWMYDSWTQKAQQVLEDFKSIDVSLSSHETSTAAQALKTLTSAAAAPNPLTFPSSTNTIADAAVTILKNAVAAQTAAKAANDKAEAAASAAKPATAAAATTPETYTVGSTLDTAA